MAASLEWEGPQPGSPPTLSGSKTGFFESIGTFCKTRPQKLSLSAAFPCLAAHSRSNNPKYGSFLGCSTPFLSNQGGSSYDVASCFECEVCDLRGERQHRLDRGRLSALEGRESARRGTRRRATTALCRQRRRGVHR